ncbi:MAG TPA: hypothetical protein VNO55_21285 [Polyangia bacterium]|nr:hypothetical protein [Polyangia bacterium]
MKTIILCGGMGTRCRDANENLPEPLLPIAGRPPASSAGRAPRKIWP